MPNPRFCHHRTIRWALHHEIHRDQATWLDQGSVTIRAAGQLNSLNPKKQGEKTLHHVPRPHGMDGPCPWLRTGDPPCGHPCPTLCSNSCPHNLPRSQISTLTQYLEPKEAYLTAEDTLGKAISLHQIQHMVMKPRLPDTNKSRYPLAGCGACYPRPMDSNARGPDRALLLLTMKPTGQLPATLEGKGHFIVESLTDNVITLAANTLAAVTDTWDDAVGHPTERKGTTTKGRDPGTEGYGPPDTIRQPIRTIRTKICAESHRLNGPGTFPGHPYGDPDMPRTQLVGRTMG